MNWNDLMQYAPAPVNPDDWNSSAMVNGGQQQANVPGLGNVYFNADPTSGQYTRAQGDAALGQLNSYLRNPDGSIGNLTGAQDSNSLGALFKQGMSIGWPAALAAGAAYGGLGSGAAANPGWTSGYDLAGGGGLTGGAAAGTLGQVGSMGGTSAANAFGPAAASGLGTGAAPLAGAFGSGGSAASGGSAVSGGGLSSLFGGGMADGSGLFGMGPMGSLVASQLLSGGIGALGASSAANTAANASNNATQAQLQMFNTLNNQSAPYRQAGYGALDTIGSMMPQFTHSFNAQDLNANMAPNYAFQLAQGQGAAQNAANRQTGLVSGNAMKGLEDYTQNYAQGAYQNAFNNYNANQTNIFNRLSNIAGLGQTANSTTANAGSTISGNAAQTMVGAGQAQAAGITGAANAITGGLNNAATWYNTPQIIAAMQGNAYNG